MAVQGKKEKAEKRENKQLADVFQEYIEQQVGNREVSHDAEGDEGHLPEPAS